MKRITFIEPVGSMQGKLSGSRKLTYPSRNNSAWEAPEGKSYATNYRPSYIGNQRSRDGVTYFSTKVRSSVTMNGNTRLIQSLLGASVSITTSMMKNPQILLIIQTAYSLVKPTETVHKWTLGQVRLSLEAQQDFAFIGQSGWSYIANPFLDEHHDGAITITGLNKDVLFKFWSILAPNPMSFTISGQKGVGHIGDTFEDIINSSFNNLQLSKGSQAASGQNYVMKDGMYVSFTSIDGESYAAVYNREVASQDLASGATATTTFFLSPTALPVMTD